MYSITISIQVLVLYPGFFPHFMQCFAKNDLFVYEKTKSDTKIEDLLHEKSKFTIDQICRKRTSAIYFQLIILLI